MVNFKRIYLLVLLLSTPLSGFSEKKEQELTVLLETKKRLLPLYLSTANLKNSQFKPDFLEALCTILRNDLNHNGKTTVMPKDKELEHLSLQRPEWGKKGAHFVVQVETKETFLKVTALSLNNQTEYVIDHFALSGSLHEDRQKIHALADALYSSFFGEPGIAKERFLYTLKTNKEGSGTSEVWEADWDGENACQLTHTGSIVVTPLYIPVKGGAPTYFLYVSYKGGEPKLFAAPLKGGLAKRISNLPGNQLMPGISFQGEKVAFISDVTGNPDLFIQPFSLDSPLQEKAFQVYALSSAAQGCPAFSPDGKKVAFVSNQDGHPRIYLLDIPVPGTSRKDLRPRLITQVSRENSSPAFSPDGTLIAYSAMTGGTRQIWLYDVRTGRESQLTEGPLNKENPAWAKNSLHLLYNTTNEGFEEIYRVHLNDRDPVKITKGPGAKRFPAWFK